MLKNFLYDASQVNIPSDNVDHELLKKPKRWQIDFIRRFMIIIGPISSIYDFLTFGILLSLFHSDEKLFHTGWFVESLATQTLVIFIRTSANPFISRPSKNCIICCSGRIHHPLYPSGSMVEIYPFTSSAVSSNSLPDKSYIYRLCKLLKTVLQLL